MNADRLRRTLARVAGSAATPVVALLAIASAPASARDARDWAQGLSAGLRVRF